MQEKPFKSPAELAEYLDIPLQTIRRWRHTGEGPVGGRFGKHIRYRNKDIERWIQARIDGERTSA